MASCHIRSPPPLYAPNSPVAHGASLLPLFFQQRLDFGHLHKPAVADEGPDVLYVGRFAAELVSDIQAAGACNAIWEGP